MLLPRQPVDWMLRHRAERLNRPRGRGPGEVLAQAHDPVIGRLADTGEERAGLRAGALRDLLGPRAGWLRHRRADLLADPGVNNLGHVAAAGERTGGDRVADDLPRV